MITTQISKIDNYTKLITYANGVQYIIIGESTWLVGSDDKIGSALKAKHFPQPRNTDKAKELIRKAEAMRANAGCNAAYNPRHATRVKAMMIGRADALYSKALAMLR